MIKPKLASEQLLADIHSAKKVSDEFHLWWLGQSGFLLQWGGKHVLFDPYLSDSLTRKYVKTDKPHTRMTELVISPDQLDFIEVVTSSHNHTDHLDRETLVPILDANPKMKMIAPEANRAFVAERLSINGADIIGLNAGSSIEIDRFTFHAVPAAHDELETDEAGNHRFLGYVVTFDRWAIYHSGDTRLYPNLIETLRQWEIDVALLPINGWAAARRVAGNLSCEEAAKVAEKIGARIAIPHHYDMFTFNTASPDDFVSAANKRGVATAVLQCGQRFSSGQLATA